MSLIIEDPHAEALAREIARREGVSPVEAVTRALEQRFGGATHPAAGTDGQRRRAALDRLAAIRTDIASRYPGESGALPWSVLKRWAEDEDGE